jgi:hypothetical protein
MSPPERSKSWNVPDVVSCCLLAVGASFVAFNRYLGPFGYPVSTLAFVIGLGYSIARVYRSTRHPQLDRKREAITSLVLNALLVILLGAAGPVYFLSMRPEGKPFEWREHVSLNGRYKIQLPDEAQEVQKVKTGPLTLNRVMVNMGQRGEYASGYYDLSDRTVTVSDEEFLNFVYQFAINQCKGTVLTKTPHVTASPDGLTIKALESEIQVDAQTASIFRLYWVRERSTAYTSLATFQRSTKNFESAEKFLDSFQLVTQ